MTYKQTFWRTLVAAAAMLLTMPATMWADSTFGGGNGTYSDPYQIYNPSHFVQLSDEVNAGNTFEGVYFKLVNSIDFTMWGQIPPIGGQYYTENGATGIRRFCGSFLGNNRTLYNVTISENPALCGIFGYLGYGGYVSDLNIDGNSTFTGIGGVGAIVGMADTNTYIFNCTVGENVVVKVHNDAAGSSYRPSLFGGIVGSTNGRVSGCVSKATITVSGIDKTYGLGGIAGEVGPSGRADESYFLGTIDGSRTVGDIAGSNSGTISYCYYNTPNRHGGVNGADTDGATWMGTVALGAGVSGSLPAATFTNGNNSYFAAGKYMLLTLDYTCPAGYCNDGSQVSFSANDVAIGETERGGTPYYEFTMPAEDVTIDANVDLKRDIAYTDWVTVNIETLYYTGDPLTPTVQVIDIKDGAQQPLTEGVHYTVTLPDEIINSGEYSATVEGIGDFAGSTTVTFRVEPAEPVARIITAPTAIDGLVYNGRSQVLITAGEVENGFMLYRLEDGQYSTELPAAISPGTYTVYYKAHSDDDHLDTSEQSLVAQIARGDVTWLGEGTAEAPYLITSVEEMNGIALMQEEMDYAGVYFSLENDLNYTNAELQVIGTMAKRFNGNFNGNNHTITNLVINKPNDDRVAIFAVVGNDGVITDLHLGEGCSITGANYVGGIAGLSSGSISGCTTASGVVVAGGSEAGGIVGRNVGKIDRCVNRASVSASNNQAGGIAGSSYTSLNNIGILSNNLNLGAVEASSKAGGIVGYDFSSTLTNNYYAGDCTAAGIDGGDKDGKAQRGYTVTGGSTAVVELVDEATVGLDFDDAVYGGSGQQVVLRLSRKSSEAQGAPHLRATSTKFVASSGTLTDNGDGTWTLTMPADNVTISVDNTVTGIEDIDAVKSASGQRYNLMGQPVGQDYKGIVIQNGKKILVR